MPWRPDSSLTVPGPWPRRLPVVPLPVAEESFFSWVDHLAYSYEVDRFSMMQRLGLGLGLGPGLMPRKTRRAALDLIRCTLRLTPVASQAVEAATGLTSPELGAMTLRCIDPRYNVVPASQMPKETWAFCPQCLAPGGRWPLWWYKPWAVACPVHRCYLVSYCPRCDTPFTPERTSSRWGASLRCRGFREPSTSSRPPGAPRELCGKDPWEIDTPPVGDPVVLDVVDRLRSELSPSLRPALWLDSYRVLDALFTMQVIKVCALDSPDPVLRRHFAEHSVPAPAPGWGDIHSGFGPVRTYDTGDPPVRDPLTEACKFSVIGRILGAADKSATAHVLLQVTRTLTMHRYLSLGPLSPDLALGSPELDDFLRWVFVAGEFDSLIRSRRTQPRHSPASALE